MSETLTREPVEPQDIRLGVVRGISYGLFGPPGEFGPQARTLGAGLVRAFAEAAEAAEPASQSTDELVTRAGQATPERRAMDALYDRMDTLPPRLQMFMAGCPAGLEARRERINCRQLVTRTLLALAEGVRRTAYWNLAPEYPGPVDHLQMMHLLIGKLPLLGYRDGELSVRHPAADTFALLARSLAGAQAVSRITPDGQPGTLHAFEAHRAGRGPLLSHSPQKGPDSPTPRRYDAACDGSRRTYPRSSRPSYQCAASRHSVPRSIT
jgi:hypothetical protein